MLIQQAHRAALTSILLLVLVPTTLVAQKRLAIIDQDGSGPGDGNQMSILALLQSPSVEILGITVVTGNAWRDEEVEHTLRMLELTGHSVPVVPGAVFPLVRTQDETRIAAQSIGKPVWLGAWGQRQGAITAGTTSAGTDEPRGPWDIPQLKEGKPATKPLTEDAAHFLVRQVHAHPGEVTILAFGPLTDIALAIAIDPTFAQLTKGIVIMGSSLNPQSLDAEYATNSRYEFNFWFDPEAARIVLRARWPRIDVTTVDVSIKAMFTQQMFDAISRATSPAARYIAKYATDRYYMYDEFAACAWLDPSLVTKTRDLYMDVDVSHGPSYGNTLAWEAALKPATGLRLVHAQVDADIPRFRKMFVDLMSSKRRVD